MISALLVGLTLTASPEVSAEEMARYEVASAEAGRDAEAHVKLALWCEQHGMSARRLEHLALALMADPANTTARGLMGLMKDGQKWARPERVAERIASDGEKAEALAEYNLLRSKAKMTADDQWDLALWCSEHGLEPESRAHLAAVVRLDPGREAAWKRLGCKKHHGRWMTQEQIDASIAEEKAQDQANKVWGPKLSRLKDDLKIAAKRLDAEREIAKIDAPRAVPTVWRLFALGSAENQARAVQIFAQTDAVPASQALAMLAVFGETDAVRRAATESLVWRDQREYLDELVAMVRKPITFELRPIGGGTNSMQLFVEGERYNVARNYVLPPIPWNNPSLMSPYYALSQNEILAMRRRQSLSMGLTSPPILSGLMSQVGANPDGAVGLLNQAKTTAKTEGPRQASPFSPTMAGIAPEELRGELNLERREATFLHNMNEIRKTVVAREIQMENDVASLNATNLGIHQRNRRVLDVLGPVTSQSFGEDPDEWAKWWTETKGYAYQSSSSSTKPTFAGAAPIAYEPNFVALHHSCFASGTPVQTIEGLKPIETIQIGDRVLTQDVKTGELRYDTVLTPVQNPPAETFRVDLGSETIVATGIHRFWKVGKGWAMVRDLKPGDRVRTVGGVAVVQGVSSDRTQPVFNLEVATDRNYFVGKTGFLVHDNSLIEMVDHPYDAAPSLAVESR